MKDPWARLGIAPTQDQAVIRRAYATLLKQTRPDQDPEGFRSLREAFEQVQQSAPRRPKLVPPPPPPPLGADPQPMLAERDLLADLARERVSEAVAAPDLEAAAVFWCEAVGAGTLRLSDEARLSTAVAKALLGLPKTDAATMQRIIERMGWEQDAKRFTADQAIVDVLARLAARRWEAELTLAASTAVGLDRRAWSRRRAASLLLLPAPGPVAQHFPYVFGKPDFAFWFDGMVRHQAHLGGRLDLARLAWCRSSRRRLDARLVSRVVTWSVTLLAVWVVITMAGALIGSLGLLAAAIFGVGSGR